MARKARAYRGAKRQKERTRQARQEAKRQRRHERRHGPPAPEGHRPEASDTPPDRPATYD